MSADFQIRQTVPCPICSSTEYEWGEVSGGQFLRYVGTDQPLLSRMFVPFAGKRTTVRQCTNCGNLQLFTEE